MSIEVGQTLDNISRLSFQIMDIYKKLIELEKNKNKDSDYYSKKKTLLEQLSYYKALEDDEYSFFNGRTIDLLDAMMLFNKTITPNYVDTVSYKIEELIKHRIIDRLENLIIDDIDFANELAKRSINTAEFEAKLKNSIAFRKADYELEEISNSNNDTRRSIFIEKFHYEAFINAELENSLIIKNFSSVPHNFNEEIRVLKGTTNCEELSQSVIDNRISNIILQSLLPELIIATPSIKTTELLIAFKILILFLSESMLKTLNSSLTSLQFQNITIKLKIKQIMDSNNKEKNKQNSDLNISFY
jgi:hypothetical protein